MDKQLNEIFTALRLKGYFAERNWTCCKSCGIAALPADTEKFVFMHEQAEDIWEERGVAWLNWGGDGQELVEVAKSIGNFYIEWDGLGTLTLYWLNEGRRKQQKIKRKKINGTDSVPLIQKFG